MRVVETPALTLEPQIAAHADEMFVVLSDPAIYEHENEAPESIDWLRTRFTKLESRESTDGDEQWLNWVIRIPTGALIGFVQATVYRNGGADIAYVLSSGYWGQGLASLAVQAMMSELADHYQVHSLSAVLKRENQRSIKLLERLGFALALPEEHIAQQIEADELLMRRENLRPCSALEPPSAKR